MQFIQELCVCLLNLCFVLIDDFNKMKYFIIPGIGGSKLYCNCNSQKKIKLYPKPTLKSLFDLNEHFFDKTCTVTTKPFRKIGMFSIYDTLVKSLGEKNCILYSYDWRRTPLDVAKDLIDVIPAGCSLIGHSNGGFIIRILIEYLKVERTRFSNIFICGTPLYGCMSDFQFHEEEKLYSALVNNTYTMGIKNKMFTKRDVKRIFSVFRDTLVYFIPSYRFFKGGELENSDIDSISIYVAKSVHMALMKMNVESYIFYYNTRKKIQVQKELPLDHPHMTGFLASAIVKKDKRKKTFENNVGRPIEEILGSKLVHDKKMIVKYKLKSDSLITPHSHPIRGSNIVHDTMFTTHSFIMNNPFLIDLIKLRET